MNRSRRRCSNSRKRVSWPRLDSSRVDEHLLLMQATATSVIPSTFPHSLTLSQDPSSLYLHA